MSESLPIVIVVAPPGTGKSRAANALAGRYGCTRIVDEWDGTSNLEPGDLALTNCPLSQLAAAGAVDVGQETA